MTPRALAVLMFGLACVMHGVDGVHDPGETVASATIDSPAPELPRRMDDCVTNLKQELGVAGSTTEAETLTLALEELRKTKAQLHVKMRKQQEPPTTKTPTTKIAKAQTASNAKGDGPALRAISIESGAARYVTRVPKRKRYSYGLPAPPTSPLGLLDAPR
jgi:hypothetical protein